MKVIINASLDQDLVALIRDLAKKEERSISQMVNVLLKKQLQVSKNKI